MIFSKETVVYYFFYGKTIVRVFLKYIVKQIIDISDLLVAYFKRNQFTFEFALYGSNDFFYFFVLGHKWFASH